MFAISIDSKIKGKKGRTVLVVIILALVLFLGILCVSKVSHTPKKEVSVDGKGEYSTMFMSDDEVEQFAKQFSYEIDKLYSLQEVYVPIEFNERYEQYNELQKKQGFDLEPYKGEKCRLYIYQLKDYTIEDKTAYMSVIVLGENVIGGHISNQSEGGEVYTFFGETL
ncbi:MAG: DUF4830 domain-containing protein [Ruminococcus sp.]|nr:DUF4830 domain-containing protein [Ruminococcus sp.]